MKLRELFDNGTHTHLDENLMELTFHGSQCTKDCSGHKAGYAWSQARGGVAANSHSPSFNKGADIGTRIIALNRAQRAPQRKMGTKPPVDKAAQTASRLAQGMHGSPDVQPQAQGGTQSAAQPPQGIQNPENLGAKKF
jgi:hypothetical protein